MPITEQSLTIEAEAQAELADRLDAHTAILAAAWIEAWNQVSVDLQDALHSLLIDAADGVISSAMVMRSERLGRALAIIANRLDVLTQQAGVVVTGDLAEIVQSAADTQQAIVASMLPEDWDTSSWTYANPATLDWIVQRTTQQITSQLEPLSDEATVGMHAELIRGVAARSNPRQVADRMLERVEGRFNGGLARTLVISRTELLDAHRAGGAAAHDANAELLAGWVWLCHLGPRTCRACIGKHGTLHPVSEPGPLGHQQCRCSRQPRVKSWADLGVEGLDDLEPPDALPDADVFFRSLPVADQKAILGERGYALWKSGRWPRSEWAKLVKTSGWRDSWTAAAPPK